MNCCRENELSEFDKRQPSYNDIESYFYSNNVLTNYLKGRVVYCNCDSPYNSNLFKFLSLNFSKLGIQKVVITSESSNDELSYRYELKKQPPVLFINRNNFNIDYMLKCDFLSRQALNSNGCFDSEECVIQLGRSDVIIAKPPVERYNEYFGLIAKSEKAFILVTPFEKLTEFNLFRNIKHNRAKFENDVNFEYVSYEKNDKHDTVRINDICVVTNIKLASRPHLFNECSSNCFMANNAYSTKTKKSKLKSLKSNNKIIKITKKEFKTYTAEFFHKRNKKQKIKTDNDLTKSVSSLSTNLSQYKKLDNYDAIVIDDLNSIPKEYEGVVAVSTEFLKHYNPSEFEILGCSRKELNKEEKLKFDLSSDSVLPKINGIDDVFRIFITKRKHYASKDLDWYRDNIFKKYTEDELLKQLNDFVDQEHNLDEISDKGKSYNKIINQFLEEVLYSARKSKVKYSPMDSLYNDALLTKIINYIESKPRFFSDTNPIVNLKRFYSGACKIAPKVANFSPNTACKIYERLCPKENANIYDYSCGFGARMLGAICSKYNYNYYGTDPNEKLCVQLNKLGEWVKSNTKKQNSFKVYCQGSEFFIKELEGKIDLAFSSPPYFDLEVYTDDDKQCENKYGDNYSAWIEFYVKPTVQNIKRYLKQDGIFALNIKNGTYGGYEHLLDDWTKCAEDEGFEIVDELTMKHQSARIALSNYMVQKYGESYALKSATEPVRVFKIKKVDDNLNKNKKKQDNDVNEHRQLSLF